MNLDHLLAKVPDYKKWLDHALSDKEHAKRKARLNHMGEERSHRASEELTNYHSLKD